MDACGRDATPDTVAATCLPPWLLPTMPARVRNKLRPDILIIEGLPLHAGIALTTASPSLSHLQRSYTLSKLVTAPMRPLAGCKRAPLKICNTSAFALRCWTLVECWRNRPLQTLTCLLLLPCPLLAGTLSSCSATLGLSLSRSQDTSSHFSCPRKMSAHSCIIYTTMQSRLPMQ